MENSILKSSARNKHTHSSCEEADGLKDEVEIVYLLFSKVKDKIKLFIW